MAVQFSPQNSSVQNVHSHALPSYLVPFDPHRQYKVCEQILRGVAGGISPWCWSACCKSEEGSNRAAFSRPSLLILNSESQVGSWEVHQLVKTVVKLRMSALVDGILQGELPSFSSFLPKQKKRKSRMRIGAVGKSRQTTGSSPVRDGSSHGQRGDGADGLRVRVSPQPPPLRLQVGQIHGVGWVLHTLPVLTCSRAKEKRERLALGVVYISVFFVLHFVLVGFSGGVRLHCIIQEKPVEFDLLVRRSLMWKEASSMF